MSRQPTTVVRVADAQLTEAMGTTGLPAAPAVRQVLADGLSLPARVLTLEESLTVALTAIEQLQTAVADLQRTRRHQRAERSR